MCHDRGPAEAVGRTIDAGPAGKTEILGQISKGIEARSGELLPTRYVHVVFTLPHELQLASLPDKYVACNSSPLVPGDLAVN